MPTGGAAARGRQSATLSRMRHERSIDPALGTLLDSLASHAESLPPDSDDAALIRVARRDFGKAIKVPADWVERVERARLGVLRCMDAGAARQRLRDHAAVSREDDRSLPRICRLLRALRPHRRSADRRRRPRHDHGVDPEAVHGAAARAGADRARDRRRAGGRRPLPARRLRRDRAACVQPRCRLPSRLRPRPRPSRQDPSSVLHAVRFGRRAHHHARARGRSRRRAVLDRARSRPRHVRAGRERRARRHAARLRRLGRRAREPVAAVGERGRARPRVLGALLSGARGASIPASSTACRSTPSIAPSTRSSAR